jgi:hypothetical protein
MKEALTNKQKACVKRWLKMNSHVLMELECPFDIYDPNNPHNLCMSWFPRCIKDEGKCPCLKYPLSTVIRRAKEMIKL